MRYFRFYESVMGRMLAVSTADALCGLYFVDQKYYPGIDSCWREDEQRPVLRETARQLDQYFAREREEFDIPLAPEGTPFQQAIWRGIAATPYGATVTYAALARCAGRASSVRAAGTATGRNPITIIVPCHRIVGSNGSLTGYAGGLPRKSALLMLEGGLSLSMVSACATE